VQFVEGEQIKVIGPKAMPSKDVVGTVPNKRIASTGLASIEIPVFIHQLIPLNLIQVKDAANLNIALCTQFIYNVLVWRLFVNLIQRIQDCSG